MRLLRLVLIFRFLDVFYINLHFLVFEKSHLSENLPLLVKIMHLLKLFLVVRFLCVVYINLHFIVFQKFHLSENLLLLVKSANSDDLHIVDNYCFRALMYDNYYCFHVYYFHAGFFDIHYWFHFFKIMDLYLNHYIFIDKNQEENSLN